MKKLINVLISALLVLATVFCFAGCNPDGETPPPPQDVTITLTFGQETAYFTSSVELLPIAGDLPTAGDRKEEKTIVINADVACKMVLSLSTVAGRVIDGVMYSVNGGTAQDLLANNVLYTSAEDETSASVTLTIFIANDASPTIAGQELGFTLSLSAVGAEEAE